MQVLRTVFCVLCLAVASFSCVAASGQYHVCTDANGKKLFSQTPCPDSYDEKIKKYEVKDVAPGEVNRLSTENKTYLKLKSSNRIHELTRLIRKNEQKIVSLKKERDTKLDSMKDTLFGLAGTNVRGRAKTLMKEIDGVKAKYNDQLTSLKEETTAYKAELAALKGKPAGKP